MKRIFLTALGLVALAKSFSQQVPDSAYTSRKLKLEEVNLVSSYYQQDGDHAAVTGGNGTQKLTDIANVFSVKLVSYDKKARKHNFELEAGIDHYTSASSDKIDLKANSSASHADTRIYPSLTWTMENEKKGTSIGAGVYYSSEFDYQSRGASVSFSKKTADRNGELGIQLHGYWDQVKLVTPTELRTGGGSDHDQYGNANRTTYAGSLSWTQVINKNLQVAILADLVHQQGFLSLPFYRVYFQDGSIHQEKLPDSRLKIPIGIRANYFLGDKIIIRTYYRFYKDDWGVLAHTANLEVPVKLNAFFSVTPFYRFYSQSAIDYFAPYGEHTAQNQYYSSNYDLSKFNSNFIGAGIRLSPPKGILGWQHFNMLEIRYGHYTKNINMNANIISLNIKVK